jgi:hypothetical protein
VSAIRGHVCQDYPYQFNADEVQMTDDLTPSSVELREFYESIATRVFSSSKPL